MSELWYLPRFLTLGLASLLLSLCEPHLSLKESFTPQKSILQGRWQFDSVRITFYDTENGTPITKASMKETPKKAWLTVGSNSWNYSGGVTGNWTYKRTADSLVISMDAYSVHGFITQLSSDCLRIQTKTQEPDEYAGYSVGEYYFSR